MANLKGLAGSCLHSGRCGWVCNMEGSSTEFYLGRFAESSVAGGNSGCCCGEKRLLKNYVFVANALIRKTVTKFCRGFADSL